VKLGTLSGIGALPLPDKVKAARNDIFVEIRACRAGIATLRSPATLPTGL
jgi:hypothetical protein